MNLENHPGQELPGDELEFLGRAKPKASIKIPIGEVQSFLPRASEKRQAEALPTFTGHESFMKFLEQYDGDLDEVEIDLTDDED